MIVNEIFESLQGEGRYIGKKVLFIRLSGCTRNCSFCDSKYHINGKKMSPRKVAKKIYKLKCDTVVWTGGEPMLQQEEIYETMEELVEIKFNKFGDYDLPNHHLETNGDILPTYPKHFEYICFSPKHLMVAKNVHSFITNIKGKLKYDIKIVTDLNENLYLLPFATLIMPLTTYNKKKDLEIQKDVWNYCIKHNKRYCPRIQVDVWGKERGK